MNGVMKKILLNTLLLLIVFGATAQKLEKYEDALPRILALPPSGAVAQLKRHLPVEPQNASINMKNVKNRLEGVSAKFHGECSLAGREADKVSMHF